MIWIYGLLISSVLIISFMFLMKITVIKKIKSELGLQRHDQHVMIDKRPFELVILNVPHQSSLSVNSPQAIEIRGKASEVKFFDLKKGYLFVIYPSQENLFVAINENEVRFFDDTERIHGSYFIRRHHIKTFLKEYIT